MNKTVTTIGGVIAILGLATAWVFKLIDATTFGAISIAVIAAITSLNKTKEIKELKSTLLEKEDEVASVKAQVEDVKTSHQSSSKIYKAALIAANDKIKELETIKVETPVVIEPISITPEEAKEVVKSKRNRKK